MSELSVIWNQMEEFPDVSEVWQYSEEDGFRSLNENSAPGNYPKHIMLKGYIGYMVMPGIYYFWKHSDRPILSAFELFELFDHNLCTREVAIMGRWTEARWGMKAGYVTACLAVDRENIAILKKMRRTAEEGYKVIEEGTRLKDITARTDLSLPNVYRDRACFDEEGLLCEELKDNSWKAPVDSDAEELMAGIGIRDICVGLKYIFLPRIAIQRYEYAYRSGDRLILINGDYYENGGTEYTMKGRKEYDLRMVEELFVRRKEMLRCGISLDRDYLLIDCREQKIRQILVLEAYELFRSRAEVG